MSKFYYTVFNRAAGQFEASGVVDSLEQAQAICKEAAAKASTKRVRQEVEEMDGPIKIDDSGNSYHHNRYWVKRDPDSAWVEV